MKSRVNTKLVLCLTLSGWATSGCSSFTDPTFTAEEQFCGLEITVATTGTNQDADGYIVSLDEGTERTVGSNGVATFSPLPVGRYQAQLLDIAANCGVAGLNPKNVEVTLGSPTKDFFVIECT